MMNLRLASGPIRIIYDGLDFDTIRAAGFKLTNLDGRINANKKRSDGCN